MTVATANTDPTWSPSRPLTILPVVCVSHGFQTNYERGFCNALAANGVDLTLISSDRTDCGGLAPGIRTLNLRGSQVESRPVWSKALNLLRYHAGLLAYTLVRRAAIVHVIGLIYPPLWYGIALGVWFRFTGARYVLTVHDLLPHGHRSSAYFRFVYGLSFRLAHRLVVHTDRMRQGLVKCFAIDPAVIVVMPHGIEPSDPRNDWGDARDPARAPLILAFGKVEPYKGIDVLLEALRGADFPFRLIVAGVASTERYRQRVAALIESHPRRDAIEWRDGFVPEVEMRVLFKAADLLVLPYRAIDQSGVLFQALRYGVPVVATRVGQFEHFVTDEVGELAEPENPVDLASALRRWAMRRPSLSRARIRELGRKHEWSIAVRALRSAYEV